MPNFYDNQAKLYFLEIVKYIEDGIIRVRGYQPCTKLKDGEGVICSFQYTCKACINNCKKEMICDQFVKMDDIKIDDEKNNYNKENEYGKDD